MGATIYEGDAFLLRVYDPEDLALPSGDPNRLLSAANGATGSLRVYDDERRSELAAAAAGVTLTLRHARRFAVGQVVELDLDDGSKHESTIDAVDPAAGTVDLALAAPSAASKGARLRRLLGQVSTPIAMTEFGTPAEGDTTGWGWEGTVPPDLAGLVPPLELRLEATVIGAGGSTQQARHVECHPFRESPPDC